MKHIVLASLLFLLMASMYAQPNQTDLEESNCNTRFEPMPEEDIASYVQAMSFPQRKMPDSIYIPVVVHNLTWNNNGYLQDSVIYEVLQKTNEYLANRGIGYDHRGFDTRIRLQLVSKDPTGQPHNGIIHQENILASHEDLFEDHFDTSLLWDPDRFLNIFFHQGQSGRASFPWNTEGFQGILVNSKLIQNDKGLDIILHELGHHFGLYHTFQDGCFNYPCLEKNDMVCDTRPDQISFQSCMEMNSCSADDYSPDDPNNPFTEDGNDMVYNYMDGGFCRSAFTWGQVERMHWALAQYKPSLIHTDFSSTVKCAITQVGFRNAAEANPVVGSPVVLENKNLGNDYIHQWYIDGNLVSQQEQLSFVFEEDRVYRVRLATALKQGECKDIFWAYQLEIPVQCAQQAIQLHLPKSMRIDSCYGVLLDYASNVTWTFENDNISGPEIQICPSQVGVQKLGVDYQQGACTVQDSFFFFVRDSIELRHYFTNYKMPFAQDTASTPLITALENVDKHTYLMFGAEYFDRGISVEDTTNAFLRYWQPNAEQAIHWELFHKAENDLSNEYGFFPNMQIFPTDMVLDSLGNIYFIAFERYSQFSDMSTYFMGRINVDGKVQWAKRILAPDIRVNRRPPIGSAEILIENGYLYILEYNSLYSIDLEGHVENAVAIRMEPDSLYAAGIPFDINSVQVKSGKIRIASEVILSNPEDYPSFENNLVRHINENTNIIITMNNKFDSLQYEYYSIDESLLNLEVVTSSEFKEGTLFLLKGSEQTLGSNTFFTLVYLDENNIMINSRQYSLPGFFFSEFIFEQVELFTLQNNEILLATRIEKGKKILYTRFTSSLQIIEHRIYEPPFMDQPFGTETTSRRSLDNNSSLLVDDGILFSSWVDERKQDKLYFYHLPLDSNFVQCDQIFIEAKLDTLPITKPKTEPRIWLEPIQLDIEDIDLHIRKTVVDVGLPECRSTYVLNDYFFGDIDSTCIDLQTIQFDVQVCRDQIGELDSVSFNVYNASPLVEDAFPTMPSTQLSFDVNQKCIDYTFVLPADDYHFLLNAKNGYSTPFTMSKTFFDAHQTMEFDYINNLLFTENQNCFVSSTQDSFISNELKVYPNPTNGNIYIQSNNIAIQNISLYTLAGHLVFDRSNEGKEIMLERKFSEGVYILNVLLNNGDTVNKKLFVVK